MTTIAQITVNDEIYKLRGVVDGFIIEFNERLLKNPDWLIKYVINIIKPESKGYLAIVNPGTLAYKKQIGEL